MAKRLFLKNVVITCPHQDQTERANVEIATEKRCLPFVFYIIKAKNYKRFTIKIISVILMIP